MGLQKRQTAWSIGEVLTEKGISTVGGRLLCDKIFPREIQHTNLLIPARETTTNQRTDTIKVQQGEPRTFIGAIYRNLGEQLLTGAEMVQRQMQYVT